MLDSHSTAPLLAADPGHLAHNRAAATAAGVAVAALGGAVLIGWALDLDPVKTLLPGAVSMKPNTALALLLAGVSLALAAADVGARRASRALAAATLLVGLATLAEYGLRLDLGVDQLLFRDPGGPLTASPGRMAFSSAVGLFLVGAALMLLHGEERCVGAARALALGAVAIATVVLVGYAHDVTQLRVGAWETAMAVHTALALAALGGGILLARPGVGRIALFSSPGAGGVLARRLLPFAVLAPLAVAVPANLAVDAGLFDAAFSAALRTVVLMGLLAWLVVGTARSLDARDAELREATERLAQREAELRRLNQDLERRARDLAAANHELEAFSYSASHDLRSPLRSIDGFAQALIEDCEAALPADGKDHLRRIRAAAQRMGQLIDDLLLLSRITRAEMRRVPVDLSAAAREIAAELSRADPGRQVTFVIEEGLAAEGDPALLRIALENLIRNAWKFTTRHPTARIAVGRSLRDGREAFFVSDDGAGFEMAYAAKLFGPFQRLHSAAEFGGTGIGLATVQRVVHRHGGRIWAEGAVEKGATFTFTLADGGVA